MGHTKDELQELRAEFRARLSAALLRYNVSCGRWPRRVRAHPNTLRWLEGFKRDGRELELVEDLALELGEMRISAEARR